MPETRSFDVPLTRAIAKQRAAGNWDDTKPINIQVVSDTSGITAQAFDEISDELRSEYVLGYYPTNDKRDGSFRKIRVEVTDKDNKVLTRKGYYAPEN